MTVSLKDRGEHSDIYRGGGTLAKPYTRKLSVNERTFLMLDDLCPPVANQFILEGNAELDVSKFREAVRLASNANPGSRVVLKGVLGGCRWVDTGVTPPVHEVDGSGWDGFGPAGSGFLTKLSAREGPTCEILLVRGNPDPQGNQLRIIYRTLHAVMDGRGTMFWVEDIFRALNGLPCVGSASTLTDTELARTFQKELRTPFPVEHLAPTGRAEGREHGMVWRHMQLSGKYPNVLARVLILCAKEARRHSEGIVRFAIPVDMRPRMEGLTSTGNLTYSVYAEIKPESTADEVTCDIAKQLEQKREGMLSKGDELYRYVPLRLMRNQVRKIIDGRHRNGLYSISGFISNMGRLPIQYLRGAGFEAKAFWGIPPSIEYFPFFMGIAGYGNILEMIVSVPNVLATGGRLEAAMNSIAGGLAGPVA